MPTADVLKPRTEQGGIFPTVLSCSPCPLLTLPESTMEAGLGGTCRVASVADTCRVSGTGWHQCSVSCTTSRTEPANWDGGLQGQEATGLGLQSSLFSSIERSWIQVVLLRVWNPNTLSLEPSRQVAVLHQIPTAN